MRTKQPEPTGFAAKAKDLQTLRDTVDQAATVSGTLWISYLFVFFYLTIAVGAVTHRDLFFENPVRLPFLSVELPLRAFFALGPWLFLIVHWYTLLHFAMLAGKVGAFHTELEAQIRHDETRAPAPPIAEQHFRPVPCWPAQFPDRRFRAHATGDCLD